jgi:hypothetical protein
MKLHKSTKCVIFYIFSPLFNVFGPALSQLQDSTAQPRKHRIVHFLINCKMNPYNHIFTGPNMWKSLGTRCGMWGECSSSSNLKSQIVLFQASATKYMRSALFWNIKQCTVAIPYRLSLKNHVLNSDQLSSLISWPSKIGPIGCPKTLVWYYHHRLHNMPERHRYQI